jgi:hypothetical protein
MIVLFLNNSNFDLKILGLNVSWGGRQFSRLKHQKQSILRSKEHHNGSSFKKNIQI